MISCGGFLERKNMKSMYGAIFCMNFLNHIQQLLGEGLSLQSLQNCKNLPKTFLLRVNFFDMKDFPLPGKITIFSSPLGLKGVLLWLSSPKQEKLWPAPLTHDLTQTNFRLNVWKRLHISVKFGMELNH